ncbi:hypothetical protein KFK09_012445 [Dendrobium nobile]|uniref:Uncharacterized protein n=1 Tax=Dendrobium nobile TaxID=94219 RepID=A0A8T3BHC6_DENNO|nr:hypothetical protein KFK09_012445 [Dendrobium nobile]
MQAGGDESVELSAGGRSAAEGYESHASSTSLENIKTVHFMNRGRSGNFVHVICRFYHSQIDRKGVLG